MRIQLTRATKATAAILVKGTRKTVGSIQRRRTRGMHIEMINTARISHYNVTVAIEIILVQGSIFSSTVSGANFECNDVVVPLMAAGIVAAHAIYNTLTDS